MEYFTRRDNLEEANVFSIWGSLLLLCTMVLCVNEFSSWQWAGLHVQLLVRI